MGVPDNPKTNFIVKFDNLNPTEEERVKAICDLILCLMELSAKQETKKFKTKKDQKEWEQIFSNFALKALYDNNFTIKTIKLCSNF